VSPAGDWCDYYAVDPALLRDVVAAWDPEGADAERRILRMDHGPSDAHAYLAQRRVYTYVRAEATPDALYVEESVVNILTHVLGLAYETPQSHGSRQTDVVEHAREVLARRFASRLTLSELSRETGSSLYHLCRLFRARTGSTIHAYLNRLRLRASLAPVLDSRMDLSGIALALGYSTHSHFTSAFRTEYGITPSSLREANRSHRTRRSTSFRHPLTAPTPAAPCRRAGGTT
jgi:AraC family transcriptional regulator